MTLLWVLVCATLATIVLQEMSARLGLVTRQGLAEALAQLKPPWGRILAWVAGLSTVAGIVAFEAGNLIGAGLGLAALTQSTPPPWISAVVVLGALLLLDSPRSPWLVQRSSRITCSSTQVSFRRAGEVPTTCSQRGAISSQPSRWGVWCPQPSWSRPRPVCAEPM